MQRAVRLHRLWGRRTGRDSCSAGSIPIALQAVDDQLFDDIVDNGKQRHANDHAYKAPQTAKQQNGEQYPEAGKAGGVAQDLGSDDVAVHLAAAPERTARTRAP